MAEMNQDIFLKIRKEIIKGTTETLVLVGQSLSEAFSRYNDSINDNDYATIIDELKYIIKNKNIKELKIVITDPALFNIDEKNFSFI